MNGLMSCSLQQMTKVGSARLVEYNARRASMALRGQQGSKEGFPRPSGRGPLMGWTGGFPSPLWSGSTARSHPMPTHTKLAKSNAQIAVIGIDIGKNVFHLIGLDSRGAIVLKCKLSRSQLENRLANTPPCLIGMEACVGSRHLSRRLIALGHDARLMPAKYVKAFLKGHKNDYRDAEAIAEAVQRPTMRFVATKTVEQLDLQALHRVRARLMSERTATVNEIRAFLLERGVAVAKGIWRLRRALP